MCKLYKAGGCGFKRMETQNNAFLMKLGYTMRSRSDLLWVQVLQQKYGWDKHKGPHKRNQHCSFLWRHLKKIWLDVELGTRWDLGNGRSTRFWSDTWVPEVGPLWLLTMRDITQLEASIPVNEFVSASGSWVWDRFKHELSEHVLSCISGIKAPM